jgi:hypothetical protein
MQNRRDGYPLPAREAATHREPADFNKRDSNSTKIFTQQLPAIMMKIQYAANSNSI